MDAVYGLDGAVMSQECAFALETAYNYLSLAKVNPYNIYGKCYDFDDNDLN